MGNRPELPHVDQLAAPREGPHRLRARAAAAGAAACVPVIVAAVRGHLPALRGIANAPGLGLVAGGMFLAAWSYLVCAKWGYRQVAARSAEPSHLTVQGPYGWARNPFDLGVGLLLLGELCLMPSLALAIYVGLCALVTHAMVIRWEEPRLAHRFGRAYAAYVTVVPRWLPRPARHPEA